MVLERVKLSTIAHGRSGDKGDMVNIALIAHRKEWMQFLVDCITPEWLAEMFADMVTGHIEVHPVPGVGGINCLLHGALQGGGTIALRKDAQGKMMGQVLLQADIEIDGKLARKLKVPLG